jgi:hypothetical protein
MIAFQLMPSNAEVLATIRPQPRWQLLHIRSAELKTERPAQLSSTNRPQTIRPVEKMDVDLEEEDERFSEFDSGSIIDPDFVSTFSGQKALAAMPSARPDILSFAQ